MPQTKRVTGDGLSKFQRYRKSQERRGMKLLRVWVPDPTRPEFAKEAKRQGKLLRDAPEEKEVMAFIAAMADWPQA